MHPIRSRTATAFCAVALAWAAPAAADDTKRAEEIVQAKCFVCHGADGESSSPLFPRLAGQHAAYIARQLADYKSGRRRNSMMQPMVADLSAADFAALGRFYASRPTHAHPVDDPRLAQQGKLIYNQGNVPNGVPACAGCHGADGRGGDAMPRLAGQHAQYVVNQLSNFDKRPQTRDNASMHVVAGRLSRPEMEAVAAYVSGLK